MPKYLYLVKKNKKGQNTAEYAILIALVVAAIIAMQTYAQRALQAKVRDASNYYVEKTTTAVSDEWVGAVPIEKTLQYEPYYLESEYKVTRDGKEAKTLDDKVSGGITRNADIDRVRDTGGEQKSTYDKSLEGMGSGI